MLRWADHPNGRLDFSVGGQGVMNAMVFTAALSFFGRERKSAFVIPFMIQQSFNEGFFDLNQSVVPSVEID